MLANSVGLDFFSYRFFFSPLLWLLYFWILFSSVEELYSDLKEPISKSTFLLFLLIILRVWDSLEWNWNTLNVIWISHSTESSCLYFGASFWSACLDIFRQRQRASARRMYSTKRCKAVFHRLAHTEDSEELTSTGLSICIRTRLMDEASKELQLPKLMSARSKYYFGKMDCLRQSKLLYVLRICMA